MLTAHIVDDHPDMRVLMRLFLEDAAITVCCESTTGVEAVSAVGCCRPDVLVLDQMMPGMTGLETARVLRERFPDLPFVFCTARIDPVLREGAAALGRALVLGKEQMRALAEAIGEVVAAEGQNAT